MEWEARNMSVKESPEEKDYQKCFAYQLGRYNGCSGAGGEKFKKVCRHCPFWLEYCKRFKEVKV